MTAAMTVHKTIRLKVKAESHNWLNKAAREVNFVWNWANETAVKALRTFAGPGKWLTHFDLNYLAAGATVYFDHIGANTIDKINAEYTAKRRQAKKVQLSWRRSAGSRKSLGWVPFRKDQLKRKGKAVRFAGKTFRVFDQARLDGVAHKGGCFAQDSCGDWWLCLCVEVEATNVPAPYAAVGIDLGLKDTATTSDGEKMIAGQYFRSTEKRISEAQRRGHKRQAKRLSRRVARQRADALHKFTRKVVDKYQKIAVGNVSSTSLVKTRMAKSVLDSGWGILKAQLHYKGQQAGRSVEIVNESYTSRACSGCGCLSGPTGLAMLAVRHWTCADCGESHDRDVNAARNILRRAEASVSVSGNKAETYAMGADSLPRQILQAASAPGSENG